MAPTPWNFGLPEAPKPAGQPQATPQFTGDDMRSMLLNIGIGLLTEDDPWAGLGKGLQGWQVQAAKERMARQEQERWQKEYEFRQKQHQDNLGENEKDRSHDRSMQQDRFGYGKEMFGLEAGHDKEMFGLKSSHDLNMQGRQFGHEATMQSNLFGQQRWLQDDAQVHDATLQGRQFDQQRWLQNDQQAFTGRENILDRGFQWGMQDQRHAYDAWKTQQAQGHDRAMQDDQQGFLRGQQDDQQAFTTKRDQALAGYEWGAREHQAQLGAASNYLDNQFALNLARARAKYADPTSSRYNFGEVQVGKDLVPTRQDKATGQYEHMVNGQWVPGQPEGAQRPQDSIVRAANAADIKEVYTPILRNGEVATRARPEIERAKRLLEANGDAYFGPGAPGFNSFKSAMVGMGFLSPEQAQTVANFDEMVGLAGRQASSVLQGFGGNDTDRDFMNALRQGLDPSTSRLGNMQRLELLDAAYKRAEEAQMFFMQAKEEGKSMLQAKKEWKAYTDANPIFGGLRDPNTGQTPFTPEQQADIEAIRRKYGKTGQ